MYRDITIQIGRIVLDGIEHFKVEGLKINPTEKLYMKSSDKSFLI